MSETEIAALYQKHGHAVFQCCLRLTGKRAAALELTLAAFCELTKKSIRLRPFEMLCRLAAELNGGGETSADDDVLLARYLADDLSSGQRDDLDARLASTSSLQVKLAVMRSERAAFYSSEPPAQFAQRVATVLASRGEAPPKTSRKWIAAPLVVGVITIAIVAAAKLGALNGPAQLPVREPVAPASIPVAAVEQPASIPAVAPPQAEPTPTPVPTPAPQPAKPLPPAPPMPTAQPASEGTRMMATFDFGDALGRVSLYEGRSKQKAVPAGTTLQVRANIPEPGYAAVLVLDPETQTLRALTTALKVEPRWHVLSRTTIDGAQRLYVIFSIEPLQLATITKSFSDNPKAPLAVDRYARIDITLAAAPE